MLQNNANHEHGARVAPDGLHGGDTAGDFVPGPAAHGILFLPAGTEPEPDGLSRLSHEALNYAASLAQNDPLVLSDRLYRFNTRPLSPRWRARLADAAAVARLLDANRNGRPARGATAHEAVLEAPRGRGG